MDKLLHLWLQNAGGGTLSADMGLLILNAFSVYKICKRGIKKLTHFVCIGAEIAFLIVAFKIAMNLIK